MNCASGGGLAVLPGVEGAAAGSAEGWVAVEDCGAGMLGRVGGGMVGICVGRVAAWVAREDYILNGFGSGWRRLGGSGRGGGRFCDLGGGRRQQWGSGPKIDRSRPSGR